MRLKVCTKWLSDQSKNAILILEKTYMETQFYQVVLLYMKDSQIDLRKKLIKCAHNKTWLKLLLVLTDIIPSGPVDLLFHLLLHSSLNGSLRKNSRKMELKSSIENAYEQAHQIYRMIIIKICCIERIKILMQSI